MNKTPLLRPLREQGATMYVFPSATEDIGLNIDSRVNGVSLSHYALLNIPDNPLCSSIGMAQQLQSYVMNFETVLLNQNDYNYQEYQTVTENVFWKWLIKTYYITPSRVTEDEDTYELKIGDDRIVQCFGAIDAGNSLSTEFGMFNETYINIPTSYGCGPVFLKNTKDSTNFAKNTTYHPTNSIDNIEYIEGRTQDSPMYLYSNTAIYDDEDNYTYNTSIYKLEISKDLYDIQNTLRKATGKSDILINSYDDINVDSREQFRDTSYDITSGPCIFDFNAILLYYSIYDNTDDSKIPYATNLFGIIFLNCPIKISVDNYNSYKIPGFEKRKSFNSDQNSFFGNSYSFRVNIKTMSVYDNTDAVIQDNTTMSSIYSVDFSDVVSNLNNAISMMNTNLYATINIQNKYNEISNILADDRVFFEDVSTKVNALIKGSITSQLHTNTLSVKKILPEGNTMQDGISETDNKIQFNIYRTNIDTETIYNENDKYTAPITITNTEQNIPAVYKPVLYDVYTNNLVEDPAMIISMINDISVVYTHGNTADSNQTVNESYIQHIKFPSTSKIESLFYYSDTLDEHPDEVLNSSILYLNYDILSGLMLKNIQILNTQNNVDEIKAKINAIIDYLQNPENNSLPDKF